MSEAHRQIPIDERDWHMLGCQLQPTQLFSSMWLALWEQHPAATTGLGSWPPRSVSHKQATHWERRLPSDLCPIETTKLLSSQVSCVDDTLFLVEGPPSAILETTAAVMTITSPTRVFSAHVYLFCINKASRMCNIHWRFKEKNKTIQRFRVAEASRIVWGIFDK